MSTKKRPLQNIKIRNALGFERALHRWQDWLDSVEYGKQTLSPEQSKLSLRKMRPAAQKALSNLGFPPCIILEVYWLCCVINDYQVKDGFQFEKLVAPKQRTFRLYCDIYDFRGQRIYPPQLWDEADRKFWFENEYHYYYIRSAEQRTEEFKKFPGEIADAIVLSPDHPVRQFIKRGRPARPTPTGITYVD